MDFKSNKAIIREAVLGFVEVHAKDGHKTEES